jgi:serine/threonine-protein kinase
MASSVQQYLGRFVLKSLRSSTSFASLYLAEDGPGGRPVALKVFSHNLPDRGYVLSGARTTDQKLAALKHPHILPVLESGEDGAGWTITEFMKGGSLKDRLAKVMTPAQVADVVEQVASALDAAHAAGIVHGNIKPANVLVDAEGMYRVADFGMASLAAMAPPIVKLFATTPSPSYMSPEQAADLAMTPRSDVYSLGVLAYQLLTGTVPYPGSDAATVSGKQARGEADDPRDWEPSLPAPLCQVVLTALARNPERRYATAGAFAAALREALSAGRVLAPEAGNPANNGHVADDLVLEERRQAVLEGLARVCWSCGHRNPEGLLRCENCWSVLTEAGGAPIADVPPLPPEPALSERKRTGLVVALSMVSVLLLTAFMPTFERIPKPSSALAAAEVPGEWTSYQFNAANTGASPGPAPALTGKVRWELKFPAMVLAPPVVTRDAIYMGTGDARVIALHPEDGRLLWQHKVNGPVNAAPALAGETLYVGLRDGTLLALDKATGEERWSVRTGGSIYGGMKVHNGAVYLGNGEGRVLALDALTGETLWQYRTRGWISSVPSITEDGILLTGSTDGNVYALDAATGKLLLKHRVTYSVDNSITSRDGVAYVARDQGALIALDLTERTKVWDDFWYFTRLQLFVFGMADEPPIRRGLKWRIIPGSGLSSSPALQDLAYMVSQTGKGKNSTGALHAIDVRVPETRWSYPMSGTIPPNVVGDTVYIASADGKVAALNRETGREAWSWRSPPGLRPTVAPIASHDTLYTSASLDLAPLYVVRLDATGKLLPDQEDLEGGDWYFYFGGTYCDPKDTPPSGPFPTQRDALTAGYNVVPSCGVFFAIE